MTQYLIVFDAHAMDHIPEREIPAVARTAHAVCQEAIDAGVFVFAGGVGDQAADIVTSDGMVIAGSAPDAIGGMAVFDVPSRQEALRWAAKLADACRCAQEVREIRSDPELEAMLREAAGRGAEPVSGAN